MEQSKLTMLENGMVLLNGNEVPYVKSLTVSCEGSVFIDVNLTLSVTELDMQYKPLREESEKKER